MSYILDALRKSEQERNPEKVPDLATHHRHIPEQKNKSYAYWSVGILLVAINLFALIYVLTQKPEPDLIPVEQPSLNKIVEQQEQETIQNQETLEIKAEPVTKVKKADIKTEVIITDEAIINEPIIETTIADEPAVLEEPIAEPAIVETKPVSNYKNKTTNLDNIPNITELDYSFQQQIPDMNFSTHIYVRDGGSFIVINDKSLGEGMSVESGLRVLNILPEGIVLELQGQQFFMDSMVSWTRD